MSTVENITAGAPSTAEDIAGWLAGKIAGYIDSTAAGIDRDRSLAEYGLDSVYAMTLCAEIEDDLGIAVEPTLAWDYPTVNAMAAFLHDERNPS